MQDVNGNNNVLLCAVAEATSLAYSNLGRPGWKNRKPQNSRCSAHLYKVHGGGIWVVN